MVYLYGIWYFPFSGLRACHAISAFTLQLSWKLCRGCYYNFKGEDTKRGWELKAEKGFCGKSRRQNSLLVDLHPIHHTSLPAALQTPTEGTIQKVWWQLGILIHTTASCGSWHTYLCNRYKSGAFYFWPTPLADTDQLGAYGISQVSMFHLLSLMFRPLIMAYPYFSFEQASF